MHRMVQYFTCELGWRARPSSKCLQASVASFSPLASERKWAESVGLVGVALCVDDTVKYLSGLELDNSKHSF